MYSRFFSTPQLIPFTCSISIMSIQFIYFTDKLLNRYQLNTTLIALHVTYMTHPILIKFHSHEMTIYIYMYVHSRGGNTCKTINVLGQHTRCVFVYIHLL